MDDPVETAELLAFARTVESKSVSRAAAELAVPRATISRRLARLEERLGVRLLRRTTRSLVLTDAGEELYRHARIVLDAVSHAERSVRVTDKTLRGSLRVSALPGDQSLYELILEFARSHPEVRLQVHLSSRYVDLQRDGYDVAIRAGTNLEPGLVARTLAHTPLVAVAAPSYLAAHGEPRRAKDLRGHRCLLGFSRGELPQTHWPLVAGGKLRVEGFLVSNEIPLVIQAALEGLGIAVLPVLGVGPHLESGTLVQVLRGVVGADARISVVYPERELMPPQVRAFVEMVVARAPSFILEDVPKRFREIDRKHGERRAGGPRKGATAPGGKRRAR